MNSDLEFREGLLFFQCDLDGSRVLVALVVTDFQSFQTCLLGLISTSFVLNYLLELVLTALSTGDSCSTARTN